MRGAWRRRLGNALRACGRSKEAGRTQSRRKPWCLRIAVAVAAWGVCGHAFAEVVELAALEQRALERHALVRAGEARERAAEADVQQAKGAYMPRIGFGVDSTLAPGRQIVRVPGYHQDGTPILSDEGKQETFIVQGVNALGQGPNPIVPQWRTTASLSIGGNIYDFGRTAAAVEASRARRAFASADQQRTRAQIVGGVRAAYLNWLSAHELHRLSTTASDDGARRSQRVSALVQEGARPRSELAPVEADRLLSELELERAAGDLAGARLMLEDAVGEPLSTTAEPDLRVLELQPAPQPAQKDASLRAIAYQGSALIANARAQRRQRAPVFTGTIGAGIGYQVGGTSVGLPSYAVGLSLMIPLWDGGQASAAADAMEARAEDLNMQLENAERRRQLEREHARLDAEHASRREQTAQKLLDACNVRVADADAGYELGAIPFEQVQAARAMQRRAQTELVLAKVARAEAVLRVMP